jgi:MtN3 and saliva related transmembrane protein
MNTEILGLIAGLLTTSSFALQVARSLKTRDTRSISLGMYSMFASGIVLWVIYGVLLESFSIIFWNVIALGLALTMIVLKRRFG